MRITELCVKRPVFAVMLISFLVVLGIFSFRDLGVVLFPQLRSGDNDHLPYKRVRVPSFTENTSGEF